MSGHIETLNVPYAPGQMFDLVSDIETYPNFIKWVKALRKSRPRDEGPVHHCVGEAVVGFKGFTERFSTSVAADKDRHTVEVRLVRGPFRKLENDWAFTRTPTGDTQIRFRIDYQFSNPVLAALAVANRDLAVSKIMEAFLREAKRRYAPDVSPFPPAPPPPNV